MSRIVGTGLAQPYSQAEMDALVAGAPRLGWKVAVCAHGTSAINAAVRAAADTIAVAGHSLTDRKRLRTVAVVIKGVVASDAR